VPALVRRFVSLLEEEQRGSLAVADDAMACLMRYAWPGNVRELANLVERLAILYPEGAVAAAQLPEKFLPEDGALPAPPAAEAGDGIDAQMAAAPAVAAGDALAGAPPVIDGAGRDLRAHRADLERSLLVQALEQSDWVVARAAKLLNLQRTTLVEKMRKFELARPPEASDD
jgi:sigma-54 specific flagellar transcriptional regulator A